MFVLEEDLRVVREKFLSDCSPEITFWTCNSVSCRNIFELISAIEGMSEYCFRYHVNDDKKKNDFAHWIRNVLGDWVLAERLHAIREKDRYVDVIKERIKEFESA